MTGTRNGRFSQQGEAFDISKEELFQALAKFVEVDGEIVEKPDTTWSEINSDLPDNRIQVFGRRRLPAPATRGSSLLMEEGCGSFDEIAALEETDEDRLRRGVPVDARGRPVRSRRARTTT